MGVPVTPAGTLCVMGDLKQMSPEWLVGQSIRGYGVSLSVGLGIPIPILNEEMVKYTAVSDDQIFTQVVDYGHDYPRGISKSYGQVSYAELKSGIIMIQGRNCLLYTSDAADDTPCVDLGGRRIIKKKNKQQLISQTKHTK
eukprot:TRINITY_DN28685_c0_g1_i2.p2 TRINITY_DN28685_c0_g1~~TRINITY_DN28685_c0_g1_i2.p2  ORF type:complete len:141 (-),score=18.37 TRINITY_DN28685_c0_g1_i2:60-482(-)